MNLSPFIFQSRDDRTVIVLFNVATFGAAGHEERAVELHHVTGASPMMKPVDVLGDDSDPPPLGQEPLLQLCHSLVSWRFEEKMGAHIPRESRHRN